MSWDRLPQGLESGDALLHTPIFIQNFNQVSYLRRLIGWLDARGYQNICVIDNNSSYPPLLRFYDELESRPTIKIVQMFW